jgi:hypothetical protein
LAHKIHLPQIEELGKLKTDEQSFSEVEQNMKQRQIDARVVTKVTVDLMNDHLVKPTRAQNMIQAFMENLNRDMKTLSQNATTHEVALESLLFHIIVSISGTT